MAGSGGGGDGWYRRPGAKYTIPSRYMFFSRLPTLGLLLVGGFGGGGHSFRRGGSGYKCSGFVASSLGLSVASAAAPSGSTGGITAMAAEVQSQGDIYMEDSSGRSGGSGSGNGGRYQGGGGQLDRKMRRVSSDVRVRFPVTTVEEQPERMVVIGDVHGDIDAFAELLRAAGLVDDNGSWAAGETVLVQAGDIFDRGDRDLEVEEWLWTLQEQAEARGGAVYHLLGNHEIMNAMGDHSTASAASFQPFVNLDVNLEPFGNQLDKFPEWVRPRLVAMAPNGPVAKMLASHSVAMKIGDSLFVHGGLQPVNLEPRNCKGASGMACLENLNRWTHEWLMGKGEMPREELWSRDSPVWSRYYSQPGGVELGAQAESELQKVLDATGTVRMIVGHTPQEAGINSALGGRLWRTDTGMTGMIGGQPEALEIVNGVASILTTRGRVPGEKRACVAGETLPFVPAITPKERESWRGRRIAIIAAARASGAAMPDAKTEAAAAAAAGILPFDSPDIAGNMGEAVAAAG